MKNELIYDHKLVKGDLIEIYAKTIANLGIFNFVREKTFSIDTTGNSVGGGVRGYTLTAYARGLHAFVARQIMDCDGDVLNASMEEGNPFSDAPSRKISLKYSDGKTNVILEGNECAIKRMKKTIDQMFGNSPTRRARAKMIIDFLKS